MANSIGKLRELLLSRNVDIQKLSTTDLKAQKGIPADLRGMGWSELLRQLKETDAAMRAAQSSVDLGRKSASAERRAGAASAVGAQVDQARAAQGEAPTFTTVAPVDIPEQQTFSAAEFVRLAEKQRAGHDAKLTELAGIRQRQEHQAQVTVRDRDVAFEQLLRGILPDMEPESVARATKLLGLPARQLPDPSVERRELEQKLAAAEQRAQATLSVLGRSVGAGADAALAAAERKLSGYDAEDKRIKAELRKFDGMAELLAAKWDTSDYGHWKLSPTWFKHRTLAGDVVANTGARDFAAAKKAFTEINAAAAAHAALRGVRDELDAAKQAATAAATLRQQLADLPARALARAHEAIASYVRGAAKEELGKTLKDEGVVRLYKAWAALNAKVEYMNDLAQKMLALVQDVTKDKQALEQQIQQYKNRERNATLPADKVKYKLGQSKWKQRDNVYRGYYNAYDRVYVYRDYYRSPSLLETWFWWHIFTSGHTHHTTYNNYYAPPDVQKHSQQNPGWKPGVNEAVAAGVVAGVDRVTGATPDVPNANPANAWGSAGRIAS